MRATAMAAAAKSNAANLRPMSWSSPADMALPADSIALEWLSPANSIALEWLSPASFRLVPMLMMPFERIAMPPMEAKPLITTRIPVGPI